MKMKMRFRRTSLFIYFLVSFSLNFSFTYAATKKCGNEACDEILFQGKVHRDQPQTHPNFLTYKTGDVIKVFGIELNDRVDLWEGELEDGTRGLFYKSQIDHEDYVHFLEKSIAENRDLYVVDRAERKFGTPPTVVAKESAADSLSRVWQIVQESLRAKPTNQKQAPPDQVIESGTPGQPPAVKIVKQQLPVSSPESTNQQQHHPPAVSAATPAPPTPNTVVNANPNIAKTVQQPVVVPPTPTVKSQQQQQQPVIVNMKSKEVVKENLHTTAESPKPELGQNKDTKSEKSVESTKANLEDAKVKLNSELPVPLPPSTHDTSTSVDQISDPSVDSVSSGDKQKQTPTPQPQQPTASLSSLLKHEHHHHHSHSNGHSHSHDHGHGRDHDHSHDRVAQPTLTVKPFVEPAPPELPTSEEAAEPADNELSTVEDVPDSVNDTVEDEHVSVTAEPTDLPTETPVAENLHITTPTPPVELSHIHYHHHDDHSVDSSHSHDRDHESQTVVPSLSSTPDLVDPILVNLTVEENMQKLTAGVVDDLQKIGTEIKNELGDEYCIKEDCSNNLHKAKSHDSTGDIHNDHVDHSHDRHDHGHHDHVHTDHGHAHDHDHHENHGHSHDGHSHGGHGHSHDHTPSVGEQITDAVKTGKSYALWIKQNLKPVITGFRFVLKPTLRLVPKEFRDWIGEREMFMFMVISVTLIIHFVNSVLDSGRQRKTMINLCKYAELYEKFKTLETENDKLKKSTFDSDKFSTEIQKERDISNSKIVELQRLKDENSALKESNAFLEEEIQRLKQQLSQTGQYEKEAKNLHKKIDELNQLNQDLERQSAEFRQSFEREREKCENFETKLTNEREIVKKLQQESSKFRRDSKDLSAKLDEFREQRELLETELSERTKELEGMKMLMANFEQTSSSTTDGAGGVTRSPGNSDSNGTVAKDWDWGDSGSDEETKKRNFEHKMAEIVNAAKLQSQLQERFEEIDHLKRAIKDVMSDKESAEKQTESLKAENESLQKSLKDAEEKTLTLQSKINVLKDFYEDQRKEMSKQLVQQQVTSQKQSNDLGSFEEDMKRLREDNALLRKTVEELKAEVKETDNLLAKARNELDRVRHETWTTVRRLEREKDSVKSENSLLRTRLAVQPPANLISPAGSGTAAGGAPGGDVSNNSSEAELGQISAQARSPLPPLALPLMPNYPPPPNVFSGHTSPFYPPPPLPPHYFPGSRDDYSGGEYGGYYSPVESPSRDREMSRDFVEMRRSYRRPKSKARSSPSRSPSPGGGRGNKDRGGEGGKQRARSRGGGSGREPSVSPPPHPRRRPRSRPRSPSGGGPGYPPYGYMYPIEKR